MNSVSWTADSGSLIPAHRFAHLLTDHPGSPKAWAARLRQRRWMAGGAIAAAGAGVAALIVMQLLPAVTRLSPVRVPLSDYVHAGAAAEFDLGVGLLSVGVLAVAAALRQFRHARDWWALGCLWACGGGLVVLAVFPESVTASGDPTIDGWLHLVGCFPAFVGPPAAALRLGYRHRRHRRAGCSPLPRVAGRLGLAATLVLMVFAAMVIDPGSDLVGAVERGLAAVDIAIAIVLAAWAWRGCARLEWRHRGRPGPVTRRALCRRPAVRHTRLGGRGHGCRRPRPAGSRRHYEGP